MDNEWYGGWMRGLGLRPLVVVLIVLQTLAGSSVGWAQGEPKPDPVQKLGPKVSPIPAIVEKDGRFALMVDGEPYLMLECRPTIRARGRNTWTKCGRRQRCCMPIPSSCRCTGSKSKRHKENSSFPWWN